MKRKIFIMVMSFMLCLGTLTVAANASELNGTQEKGVKLDTYFENQSEGELIYGVKPRSSLLRARPSSPNANKGYFWVYMGWGSFDVYFDNDYYVHRVKAKNSKYEAWSSWAPKRTRAYINYARSLTGNEAYWGTK
jgi:hypothetical protein